MDTQHDMQHERPSTRAAGNDQLSGHNYDGIQEYDNPTPGWWTWIFVLSVVFSIPYFVIVTLSQGDLGPPGFYERSVQAQNMKLMGMLGELSTDRETMLEYTLSEDPEVAKWKRDVGGALFQTHCVSCHGRDASGVSGPNLTDDNYIHVKRIEDITDVLVNGRNNGAMPAWNTRMNTTEIVLVSAYVASLRGQDLPTQYTGNEGQPIEPWGATE